MNACKHKATHYTVKRLRLLKHLVDSGFTDFEVIPDPTNPKYNWFLFENTPALEKVIEAYFDDISKKY